MTVESTADKTRRAHRSSRRDGTTRHRQLDVLTFLAAAAGIGLAACSGGHSSPHVASLGTTPTVGASSRSTGGGDSATTVAKGNPTALLDAWATCMHSHGDPNQAAPTIDAYGVIHVTIPSDAQSLANEVHAGADPCNQYMAAAQSALRAANPVASPPDQAEQIRYVDCMRANGIPNYPYPQGTQTSFEGTGVDPNSPRVQNVNKLCGQKLHLPGWWIAGTGPPGDIDVSGGPSSRPANDNPPPCFFAGTCPYGSPPVSDANSEAGANSGSGSNG